MTIVPRVPLPLTVVDDITETTHPQNFWVGEHYPTDHRGPK